MKLYLEKKLAFLFIESWGNLLIANGIIDFFSPEIALIRICTGHPVSYDINGTSTKIRFLLAREVVVRLVLHTFLVTLRSLLLSAGLINSNIGLC